MSDIIELFKTSIDSQRQERRKKVTLSCVSSPSNWAEHKATAASASLAPAPSGPNCLPEAASHSSAGFAPSDIFPSGCRKKSVELVKAVVID